jgi:hypothetical protein
LEIEVRNAKGAFFNQRGGDADKLERLGSRVRACLERVDFRTTDFFGGAIFAPPKSRGACPSHLLQQRTEVRSFVCLNGIQALNFDTKRMLSESESRAKVFFYY